MSQSYNHLPLATETDLRTRRRQGSRKDQQGSDEREGAVFRDTASLVTTTGSSRLPANPALECFKMRWTLEVSAPGKMRHLAACWPPSTPSNPPAGTAVPGRRVRRPAVTYRPCLMLAAILQANGRSAIEHILNIDHLPGRGMLIVTHGKVQAPRPAAGLADTKSLFLSGTTWLRRRSSFAARHGSRWSGLPVSHLQPKSKRAR